MPRDKKPRHLPELAWRYFRRYRLGRVRPRFTEDLDIVDRLEADTTDLNRLWAELTPQLNACPECQCRWRPRTAGCSLYWLTFLDMVIRNARLYMPERLRADRDTRAGIRTAARRVAALSEDLARALGELETLCQDVDTYFPGLAVMLRTVDHLAAYSELKPVYKGRFPSPYYADVYDLLACLSEEAVYFTAEPDPARIPSRDISPRIFVENLARDCAAYRNAGLLPAGFVLSSAAWATVADAALGLQGNFEADNLKSSAYNALRRPALLPPPGRKKKDTEHNR